MCFLLLFLYFNVILYHCSDTGAASIVRSQGKGITLKVNNRKFVEEIKQELTNNNDDYLESSPLTPTSPRAPLLHIRNEWRRNLNANSTANTTNSSSTQIESEAKEKGSCSLELKSVTSQENTRKDIDVRESKNPANRRFQPSTFGRSVDTATTRIRKKKSRKPRKSKSKDLLKSLLKNPLVARDTVAPPPPAPPSPQMRARLELSREKAPDSNQLDMAPAQGVRIENMRLKNRLCQRNVLIPEGPKYDSRGRIYLAAHAGRGPRADYARTRPRRLVLPRCCNCCRKSVLGCE